jgi:hypothetical protein
MRARRVLFARTLAATVLLLGGCAWGALTPADALRKQCDRITAHVEAGRRDHLECYGYLEECGPRGMAALARSWTVWKRVSDRAALVRFANITRLVRDPRVFDAMLEVAGDETAIPTARALALRNLRVMRDPGAYVPLENLEALGAALAGPDGGRDADTSSLCGYNLSVSDAYVPPGPAPSPAELQRLSALKGRLLTSATTPPIVKAGAFCG